MATIVKRAIRTAAGWATMSAPEKAVYDDIYFETLTAWEATIPADLVANDEQWVAEWYNDWPTGLVDDLTFSGARITDSTRDVILSPADGEGHNGDLTGCLLDGTIIVRNGYYTIKGFRITGDAGVGVNTTTHSGSEEIIIDSLIIHDSTKIGLTHDANNVNWVVRNTLFINT
ncbi:MAG: hypothetical protein GY829_15260, partial [Gammaproteobacteria bacterium]|nr:hypothetical protein [Gammaproteobacteria bacterium]